MPKENDEKGYHALPKDIVKDIASLSSPNLSLKYYKWVDIYKDKEENHKVLKFGARIKDKGKFLESFIGLSEKKCYASAMAVRKAYFENMGGVTFTMKTACRLLFGIGYDHPTEIGFLFDWTTGLPVIPGSSLKGAARAAARDTGWKEDQEIKEIFGKEMKEGEKESEGGRMVFLPAYPVCTENQSFLDLDVMTPHYTKYYEKPEIYPPADYYAPEPHKFLTVPAGITYHFRILDRVRPKLTKEDIQKLPADDLLKRTEQILKAALTEAGVGAKTNVFYGYFNNP